MPPKKAKVRLTQSEVFFPPADHAIVAHHVVPTGICPGLTCILNRRSNLSILSSSCPIQCGGRQHLFASIILVSEEYHCLKI